LTEKDLGGSLEDLRLQFEGKGLGEIRPVAVNHGRDGDVQVQQLFETIEKDYDRLDILVNNVFQLPSTNPLSTYKDQEITNQLFKPYWELPPNFWDSLIDVGLRSHYVTSHYATPLMLRTLTTDYKATSISPPSPLIIHISSFGGTTYSFNTAYGVGKAAVDRLAKDMNYELQKGSSSSVRCWALYPGIVRTERMQPLIETGEFERRTGLYTPLSYVESPELSGEVIAAIYLTTKQENKNNDYQYLTKKQGQILITAELAKRYQLVDRISQCIPPSIRSLKYLIPALILHRLSPKLQKIMEPWLIKLSPDILLPLSVMASGGSPNQ
jgi:dehydrogenase/reductase SDR family member 1